MDNLQLPAYPLPLVNNSEGEIRDATDWEGKNTGFTKLEKAMLIIGAGIARDYDLQSPIAPTLISKAAKHIATAILEEANK